MSLQEFIDRQRKQIAEEEPKAVEKGLNTETDTSYGCEQNPESTETALSVPIEAEESMLADGKPDTSSIPAHTAENLIQPETSETVIAVSDIDQETEATEQKETLLLVAKDEVQSPCLREHQQQVPSGTAETASRKLSSASMQVTIAESGKDVAKDISKTVCYAPGEEPAELKHRVDQLIKKLTSAYPDKTISGLSKDHKSWAKTLTDLYRALGYPDGSSMLKAYGFTVQNNAGGRPSNETNALIDELKKRYPQPFIGPYSKLVAENPDLASKMKTMWNSSQTLFGMSISSYLVQEGIMADKPEPMPVPVKPAPSSKSKKATAVHESESAATESISTQQKIGEATQKRTWKDCFTHVILNRGWDYYQSGNITSLLEKEGVVTALVKGDKDYSVLVEINGQRIHTLACSCPYARKEQNCKHMAAVLYSLEQKRGMLYIDRQTEMNVCPPPKSRSNGRHSTASSLPEVWEPPVYQVEEINITGDALSDWIYERVPSRLENPPQIYIVDYCGDKDHIILPSYINGEKVTGLSKYGSLEKCRATYIEIPGTYGELEGVSEFSTRIETLVIGEGITRLQANILPGDLRRNGKDGLLVSASVQQVDGWCMSYDSFPKETWCILGSTLVSCRTRNGTLCVPQGVKTISSIEYNESITKVVLPDSVTTVYDGAFSNLVNLTEFVYTPTLTNISHRAFCKKSPWYNQFVYGMIVVNNVLVRYTGCGNDVIIPQGVIRILPSAFDCFNDSFRKQLCSLTLPESLKEIPPRIFAGCSNLSVIHFSEGLTAIGDNAFKGTAKLKAVSLPNSLVSIGDHAFEESGIETVSVGTGLRIIGDSAFYKCKNLQRISMNDGLRVIGTFAFSKCNALTTLEIPSSVESIGSGAFSNTAIQTMNLGHVSKLSWGVFSGCTNLKQVTLPSTMEIIPSSMFNNCTSLRSITLPKMIHDIEEYSFAGCISLQSIVLPTKLNHIGSKAFARCQSLENISLNQQIDVAADAFEQTPFLQNSSGEFVVINGKLIKYTGSAQDVVIPEDVRVIGAKAFSQTLFIAKLYIGDQVELIEEDLFGVGNDRFPKKKPMLTSVYLGDGITKIGESAFAHCELQEIRWGKSITQICKKAFRSCQIKKLDLRQLPLERIEQEAFMVSRVETAMFPPSLQYIGDEAFAHSPIKVLDLSNTKVQCIGTNAFNMCWNLTKIVWPDTIRRIDPGAFNSTKLDYVRLPQSVNQLGEYAFGCASELELYDIQILQSSGSYAADALRCRSDNIYDARQRGAYYISVRDSQTEKIMYRIAHPFETRECWMNQYRDWWKPRMHFDFEQYDSHFMQTWSTVNRAEMALCRLQYPYGMSEKHRRLYVAWLEQCLYLESSARCVAEVVMRRDSVEYLQLLEEYHSITESSLPILLDTAKRHKAKACLRWLEKCRMERGEI